MPRKALRCVAEITVHAVTCPGVYLPRRDDVYLSVSMFGQTRRTQLTSPIFPLLFHETFRFDKIFYTAYEPTQVADALEGYNAYIELIQLSPAGEGTIGHALCSFESSARLLLYPYPSFTTNYGTHDREVMLERSLEFPGIAPKLEFATKTAIRETTVDIDPYPDISSNNEWEVRGRSMSPSRQATRGRRSRSRSKGRSAHRFSRPTVSSITRARSLSPTRRRMECLHLVTSSTDTDQEYDDVKPPFVVRKVGVDLIGRVPGTQDKIKIRRSRSKSPTRSYTSTGLYDYNSRLSTPYRSRYESDLDSLDVDLRELTIDRPLTSYSRYRARSPSPVVLRSSLRDRYDYDWKADNITSRVDQALRRNRSLERIDTYRTRYGYSDYDVPTGLLRYSTDDIGWDRPYYRRKYLV